MSRPKATGDERKHAVVLYTLHGLTIGEIAAGMGWSYQAVWGWLHKAGVLRRTKRSPAPPPTEDEKHHAVTRYVRDGLSIREVAAEVGRSYGVVQGWLKDAGVLRPHVAGWDGERPTDAQKHTAVELYTQRGLSIRQVAAKVGKSYDTVRLWLKAAGVLRPPGGGRRAGREIAGHPVGPGT